MSVALSPLERLIIVTARKYLVGDSEISENVTANKIPLTSQDALVFESTPWCDHWLYGKITNEYRSANKKPPDLSSFQKALSNLIKKKFLKAEWSDRYILIVEASRFVK